MLDIKMIYNNEKGMVLPLGLMFMAIIAILGTTAVIVTTTDLKIGTNYKLSEQAFYAAEAGIEEARARFRGNAANNINDDGHTANPAWQAFIGTDVKAKGKGYDSSNANHIRVPSLQFDLDYVVEIIHQTNAAGDVLYWGDPDGDGISVRNTAIGQNIYLVTSYGYSGTSTKVIEVEVARKPGPPIEAALYARGDVQGNGNALLVDGKDNCGAAPPKSTIYTLDPCTTALSGTAPSNFNPTAPEKGPMDINILAAINNLKASTNVVITDDENNALYGDAGNFVTCYSNTSNNVNGLSLSGVTGFGMLLIEGDLILGGGFSWNGLILVTGTLSFNGGGLGVNIQGAVLANKTIDINGGVDIKYNSCMVDKSLNNLSLDTISWKDTY